jgi:intein/homing endonuclease
MQVEKRDGSQERRILTAMIVDSGVLSRLSSRWTKEGLFNSRWSNIVAGWCTTYFNLYKEAPKKHIVGLFENWAEDSQEKETVAIVEKFLEGLSDEYEALAKESNTDFILDLAGQHFDKVRLARLAEQIQGDLDRGDVDKARQRHEKSVRIEIGAPAGVNVLSDHEAIKRAFKRKSESIVVYPGALGNFFRDALERDALIAFQGPEKRGKCILEDSLIPLADGREVSIKEYVDKRMSTPILVQDQKTKRFKAKIPDQLWKNGKKPCYEVVTRSGRKVATTFEHQYQTPSGWRYLEDLCPGDFIAVPKKLEFFGKQTIRTPELRFVAYMIAEGCTTQSYTKGKKNGVNRSFTNVDPVLIWDFLHCCLQLDITWRKEDISYELHKQAGSILKKYGLSGCSARTKEIPNSILSCSKDQIREFLQIIFSCDGSIYLERNRYQIEITLANERLIRQIGILLTRFGIVHKIGFNKTSYQGKEFDSWRLDISSEEYVNLFLQEINFLSRKKTPPIDNPSRKSFLDKIPYCVMQQVWDEIKEEGRGSLVRVFGKKKSKQIREQLRLKKPIMRQTLFGINNPKIRGLLNSEVLWDEVISITYIGKKETYDLGVDEDHCFVANNVLVHNTWWLLDLAWRAMLQGRRVAFFEVGDMSEWQIMLRFMTRAAKRPLKATDPERPLKFPINIEHAPDSNFAVVEHEDHHYANNLKWKEAVAASSRIIQKRNGQDLLRLSTHANGTIGVDGLYSVLESWERDGWGTPDVVVIDYVDLLTPPHGFKESRDQINATWKGLRRMSQEYHALVVTATQADADSYTAETQTMANFSEDKRKNAHVTGIVGINQTPAEKSQGLQRLNWLAGRAFDFSPDTNCHVAGCLGIANPAILSIF